MVVDLEFLRSLWDRYLDLYPFYYLSTCALARYQAKTKIKKMIYSRRFLVYIIEDQQVLWRRCRGLVNSPLVIVS